jgi:hypothetical protein
MPASGTPTALVIWIHGGGFQNGDKSEVYDEYSSEILNYLNNNIAFATINYRFLQETGETEGVIKPLNDGKRALQFLRYHASTYHLDKNRIGLMGGSAGASMSFWLATRSDMADPLSGDPVLRESTRVQAIALNKPQASLNMDRWESDVFALYGWTVAGAYASSPDIKAQIKRLYGISNPSEYFNLNIIQYRQDVDMLYHLDGNDPPIWAQTDSANEVPEYLGPGDAQHHPRHVETIRSYANLYGIENVTYSALYTHPVMEDTDEFLIRILAGDTPPTPSCTDGIQNGNETGIDCGGPDCDPCASCNDGIQNGNETGIDCGGPDCTPCVSCNDGIQNGNETGIDCGGPDCAPCQTGCEISLVNASGFELGEYFWSVTGSDSRIKENFNAYSGSRYALIKNSTATSNITSASMNLSDAEELQMSFYCAGVGLESNEGFRLEISPNNGSSWYTVATYRINDDFTQNIWSNISVVITQYLTAQTQLRFVGTGNANDDRSLFDEITVEQCTTEGSTQGLVGETTAQQLSLNQENDNQSADALPTHQALNLSIYPNPINKGDRLNIEFTQEIPAVLLLEIIDAQGRLVQQRQIPAHSRQYQLNIGELAPGLYFLKTVFEDRMVIKKIIVR